MQKQKFYVIFWNHPFYKSDKKINSEIEKTVSDYKYKSLEKYFQDFEKFLKKDGKCLLGTGNMSGYFKEINELAINKNCKLKLIKKTGTNAHKKTANTVELGLYEVTKII